MFPISMYCVLQKYKSLIMSSPYFLLLLLTVVYQGFVNYTLKLQNIVYYIVYQTE